ncbi:MAG: BamA/TamA family outer membrane protein [Gemmatimonadetes bacterium]|nr:BamA/TamA family outer membrane protein [Gemmatimonadota bacterium]
MSFTTSSAGLLLGLVTASGLVAAGEASAQTADRPPQYATPLAPGDTVVATPAGRYPAGFLHRWTLGGGWREMWETPVRAPVLDLGRYAGGLTPLRLGGGQQTRSLRFQGEDGLVYNFRSIDKDVSRGIDPFLRESLAQDVLQDQVSALFPLSAMVVAPLLEAVGVLHPNPTLVVMPDVPELGEYRGDFAGLLGWIEVRPDEGEDDLPGFEGSERVVGTDRLFERLEERADNRVVPETVLRARLVDMLIGDWDRHPDQWRWAGFESGDGLLVFEPVPRDRDWALTRLDGLVSTLTQVPWPYYLGFSEDYASVFRQSWNGRGIDRRLLVELTRSDVRGVALDLQSRLTDAVIEDAVRRLPAPYYDRVGEWLEGALKNRRDGLVELADGHYLLHAGWVDVQTTDEAEQATIIRLPGGALDVRVELLDRDEAAADPVLYERRFVPDETREVRLYLRGGDDRVIVSGDGEPRIRVRVIGGGADDHFEDRTSGDRVHLYDDDDDDDVFEPGPSTSIDREEWDEPSTAESEVQLTRPRDWGARWVPVPGASYDPNLGVFLTAGVRRTAFGFRRHPWEHRLDASIGAGTAGTVRGALSWERHLGRSLRARAAGFASSGEFGRFYGLGNDTPRGVDEQRRARWSTLRADLGLTLELREGVALHGVASLEGRESDDEPDDLIAIERPYGAGAFNQVALGGGISVDRRDDPMHPRHGFMIEASGRWHPEGLDVEASYATARGEARGYWSSDDETALRPSLALRVGGERAWGRVPWFASAFLGGPQSVRGYVGQRFAGDTSVWGNAELRLFLTEFLFGLPGDLGVLGLLDAGRVWLDGASPGDLHTAVGGGVWANFVDFYTVSLTVAASDERTTFHFGLGLPF